VGSFASVDFVIPVHDERSEPLEATVRACLGQSLAPGVVWVVDDGSLVPTSLSPPVDPRVRLIRLPQNGGISAARMAAMERSRTPFVACVNVDVLPDREWLRTCLDYLVERPRVGAVYARLVPADGASPASRWRMRFHETSFERGSGAAPFAPGHAVLLRRTALDAVGGYDARRRTVGEDSDLCERMWRSGWETHYVATASCVSIQPDSPGYLGRKQLLRDGFDPAAPATARGLWLRAARAAALRIARNLLRGRWSLLAMDVAVWAHEMRHFRALRSPPTPALPVSCVSSSPRRPSRR
jgi:cellulose synthase/poly-beta-1,6-N-acetylglucosamine synthase-like glycosyltransferase